MMDEDAKLVATRHPISLLLNLLPWGRFLFLRTSHHFFKKKQIFHNDLYPLGASTKNT